MYECARYTASARPVLTITFIIINSAWIDVAGFWHVIPCMYLARKFTFTQVITSGRTMP